MRSRILLLIIGLVGIAFLLIYVRIWVPSFLYRPSTDEVIVQFVSAVLDNDREQAFSLSDGSEKCWALIRTAFDKVSPLVRGFEGEIIWAYFPRQSSVTVDIMFMPDTPPDIQPNSILVTFYVIESQRDIRRYACGSYDNEITTYEERVKISGKERANASFNFIQSRASRKYVRATPQD